MKMTFARRQLLLRIGEYIASAVLLLAFFLVVLLWMSMGQILVEV